jgi:transposase
MKHEMTVVSQTPYSPDLAPVDFLLLPKLKSSLKGRQFQTVEEIEENSIWEWSIKSGGKHFEGNKFD